MTRKYYSLIIGFLSIILAISNGSLYAQNSYATTANLEENFIKKVTNRYQEKVFIHTDKELYITGETIWMKAYCVDAMLHRPSDLSKVLSIEILDLDGNVFEQTRIQLRNGHGAGQFFVSPDVKSGEFVLRAYTNWMRNFAPELVYQKKITILNPSSLPAINGSQPLVSDLIVEFFPEGGELVNGLKSKVAIKVANKYNAGLSLEGIIFDNDENEITKFKTSSKGYSYFNITPESGKTYTARFLLEGVIKKYKLPISQNSGIVLAVNYTNDKNVDLAISSTESYEERIYVVLHTRGLIQEIRQVDLTKFKNVLLSTKQLKSGVSHITILDKNFSPLAERLVFQYPEIEDLVKIDLNKGPYGKRQKISISVDRNMLGAEDNSQFSVSVFLKSNPGQRNDNIVSNLLLTSDLKGFVPNSWDYFDPENNLRKSDLDLLLLTHGWRRFEWQNILGDEIKKDKYFAEVNAPVISGRILDMDSNDKINSLQMSFVGRSATLNSIDISQDGQFSFETPFRIRNEKVHFFINNRNLPNEKLYVESPYELAYSPSFKNKVYFDIKMKEYLEKLTTNIQISQLYKVYNFVNGQPKAIKNNDYHFYGKPDKVYLMDDYTRFETIEDLFIEYISAIYIRKRNQQKAFYVVGETPLPGKALVLLDGLPIQDFDFIMALDPLDLEKIDVVNRMYYVGNQSYSGIVNFSTYKGDFAGKEVPENLVEKVYHALQSERVFYSPDYSNLNQELGRIPDFRNTLYWNPDVSFDGNNAVQIDFYSSDDTGEYQIQINGITATGIPFQSVKSFSVVEE